MQSRSLPYVGLLFVFLSIATIAAAQSPVSDDDLLRAVYTQRQNAPLWLQAARPTPQALQLLTLLRDAELYGLRTDDYRGNELSERLIRSSAEAADDAALAQFDRDLSTAALRFIKHVHYGRVEPRNAGFRIGEQRHDIDLVAQLLQLATAPDTAHVIANLEPPFNHYRLLKASLARYRLLAVDEQLTQLPPFTARSLKPGEHYDGAPALRRLLVAERDLAPRDTVPDDNSTLDPALVAALQHYQKRHGLQNDGTLGKQTFAALTTSFAVRVRQIELTLERWRWFPALQAPPIVVNIPQFRLFAFQSTVDREADMLRMDVIVGRTAPPTRTPVFSGEMKYVVFRPYWDVPRSIVRNEILPHLARDPGYLQRNHFELVNGQRDDSPVVPITPDTIVALHDGRLRLRQQPGDDNPLGAVKFLLPNDYNVYLHGTSARHLFNAARRTFSHGCIRVGDPPALAELVLRNAAGEWPSEKIADAMNNGPWNQRITLSKSIPVMILYGTAMANEAGEVLFFNDIYGYDRKLEQLLRLTPVIAK